MSSQWPKQIRSEQVFRLRPQRIGLTAALAALAAADAEPGEGPYNLARRMTKRATSPQDQAKAAKNRAARQARKATRNNRK